MAKNSRTGKKIPNPTRQAPVAKKKVVRRVVRRPKYLPGQQELAEIRQLVSDMNYKLVTEEMRRTKALEDIATSLRVGVQYIADFFTQDRVKKMLVEYIPMNPPAEKPE